jgi:hypothetical protein
MNLPSAIILYLVLSFILIFLKPNIFLDKDGNIKPFGTGENKSIIPLWLVFMFVGIFSYFVVFLYHDL